MSSGINFPFRKPFSSYNETTPEWKNLHEYIRYLLWAAVDTLLTNDKMFQEKGMQRLNLRSAEYLDRLCNFLTEYKIDEEQAINFIGEWIGIILAREPEYFMVIEQIVLKIYKKKRIEHTDNLFLNIFSDGYFVDWTWDLYEKKLQDRQATKGIISDYLSVRQQAEQKAPLDKKNTKCIECLLSEKQLQSLHNQLIASEFISPLVSFTKFRQIFSRKSVPFDSPIQWLKKSNSLGYLFYDLDNNRQYIAGKWQTLLGDANKVFSVNEKVISTSNYSSIVNNLRASLGKGKINSEQQTIKAIIDKILAIKE